MNKLTPPPLLHRELHPVPHRDSARGHWKARFPTDEKAATWQPWVWRPQEGKRQGRERKEKEVRKTATITAFAELCRKGTQSGSGSVATHRVGPTLEEPTSSLEKERKGQKGPPRVASHEDLLHAESLPSAGSV